MLAGVGIEEHWANIPEAIKTRISTRLFIYPKASAMIELVLATTIQPVTIDEAQPVYVRNQASYDKKI